MIEILKQKISVLKSNSEKYNTLREYLQLLILKTIDEQGLFRHIAFLGGTALRVLYNLDRFSEDLDFNMLPNQNLDYKKTLDLLTSELTLNGLDVDIIFKDRAAIATANIKFNAILYELGISDLKDQKILIKLEIDKNPATGFSTQFNMVDKEFLINILHLDKPSLFSGKLLALFCRQYCKGRDYYDLMWFLTHKIKPNLNYLNAGFKQQSHASTCSDLTAVENLLTQKIEKTDFNKVLLDVKPFLLDPKQQRFFKKDTFLSLINTWNNDS